MPQPHLQLILGSTRQGRHGEAVGRWFADLAGSRGDLTAELLDLRDWPLPFLDTPMPPAMQASTDPATQAWAAKLAEADGYVLMTPEYNHGPTAVLKNALDHVYTEWRRKPVGFVSWGGPAGGARAVEQLRQVAVELQMAPMRNQVAIPMVFMALDDAGRPRDPRHADEVTAVLNELVWWSNALSVARAADVPATAAA